MRIWIRHGWELLRASLWFLPALMSLGAILLAVACARLDRAMRADSVPLDFLYRGDAESARMLFSTVAGSMITVAGVAFSVTMVALSLASSQLGPRLLTNFMRDRGNQVVLGGFIATFLFCLLALGSSPDAGGSVPVSASVALVLTVGSLLLLIYFIHHIASSMQADYVIQDVAADVDRSLAGIFPDAEAEVADATTLIEADADDAVVRSPRTGYLQRIDEAGLLGTAMDHDLRLHVLHRPGHYLTDSVPLVALVGVRSVDRELERRIQSAFIIGGSRTPGQDPEYGIHQLVEIALRALSPGINDPFTAVTCIDHLSGILSAVAAVPERPPVRWDPSGELRLQLDPIDFQGVLEAAFNQIRQSAAGTVAVSIRLLEALELIAEATRDPQRLRVIEHQARMVFAANADMLLQSDRSALERRLEALQEQLRLQPG